MKPFLLAFFVAIASARPEPPVGYNYQAPSSGGASFGPGPIANGFGGGFGHGGSAAGFGHGGSAAGFDASSSFSGAEAGAGAGGYSSGGTVHKHVYVHVAPEEPQQHQAPKVYPTSAPQKHYKIIFIKAPTAPTPTAPVIPVQPQNEEKTLVYVLVKKPEEQPEIVIPTPAPTQPSKPEVYFIRYKTQKESGSGAFDGAGAGAGAGAGGDASLGVPAEANGAAGHGAGADFVGGDFGGATGAGASFSSAGASAGAAGYSLGGAPAKYGPPGYHN